MPTSDGSARRPATGVERGAPSPTTTRLIGLALDVVVVVLSAAGAALSPARPIAGGALLLLASAALGLQLARSRVAAAPGW